MNQVYCLYRVSTNQQLHEDDIPMQRQACRKFAEVRGWAIVKELYEKGISGFKTPTCDRQVLQQIKMDADLKKFDILLVFMFDRLGRRDSETPFFVEELAMCGIEIWSVKEGQQRFESHTDKLVNYIRYWQASGESLKISERIKTRMGQLTQEGFYTGGPCPYGYRLVKNGRINSRGHEVHDLKIAPDEAVVIQKIFDYRIRYGYGSRKISSALAAQGILNRNGEPFHYSSITNILKRRQLIGILCSGESQSAPIPELQIITPETFEKAQRITKLRTEKQLPPKIMGNALLSGNIYCGHCGGRMFATTARKSHHQTVEGNKRIPIYKCYNRVQHPSKCKGQTSYRASRIDQTVLEQLSAYCETRPSLQKAYMNLLTKELHIQKMAICQWIKAVVVFSYDYVEINQLANQCIPID